MRRSQLVQKKLYAQVRFLQQYLRELRVNPAKYGEGVDFNDFYQSRMELEKQFAPRQRESRRELYQHLLDTRSCHSLEYKSFVSGSTLNVMDSNRTQDQFRQMTQHVTQVKSMDELIISNRPKFIQNITPNVLNNL